MHFFERFAVPYHAGICYSGFRDGQAPGQSYPSYEEVKEDLLLLAPHWKYLRLYDCDAMARTTLEVIRQEGMDFKVMLGAYITAEINNPDCPWEAGVYEPAQLEKNKKDNDARIQTLADWGNEYSDIIFALSVGNEACVDWTDHAVAPERVLAFVETVKKRAKQPVTFCENYVPWYPKLAAVAAAVDFISIHTYPLWENKTIAEALAYTIANFESVAQRYPGKPVVISEAGWATSANGRGFNPALANQDNQFSYYHALQDWCRANQVLCFFFEAFDEAWKGSDHPLEPEKHWGLYYTNRVPKITAARLESTTHLA